MLGANLKRRMTLYCALALRMKNCFYPSNGCRENGREFDLVVIYQPKAKELLDYLLASVLPLL